MAATLTDQNTGNVAGTTGNTSIAVNAGDRIVVVVREQNGTGMGTVSSSIDGNLTLEVSRVVAAAYVAIWSRPNCSAGTHTITVPTGGGSTTYDFNANAWGGCATVGGADTTNNNGGSATSSFSHGSITPSASALIITAWGGGSDNGGETPGGDGMTALNVDAGAGSGRQYYQYKTGHTGAIDGDFTSAISAAYEAVIAAFLESEGSTAKNLTLLSVG